MSTYHKPVLCQEVLAWLRCRPGGIYVDGTLGGGGHAEAILEKTAPDGLLIGIDRDRDALAAAEERLQPFGSRKILVRANFTDIGDVLTGLKIGGVDGIVLDLGVSSHQLNAADRGFSFSQDAPLDMRMDRDDPFSARDFVNLSPEQELRSAIRTYGEEPMARRIAKAILIRREEAPIRSTAELADVVTRAVPASCRRRKIHPATKTFQAIRIAVNEELSNLRKVIPGGIDALGPGGRFCIISFHSLEDRIVKESFRSAEKGCVCPPGMPVCTCQGVSKIRVLTRRPVRPTGEEVHANPRARSARLRAAERR